MGRFLSQDPWEGVIDTPPSLHRYLYAYQNPTVWWDPTGRESERAFWEKDRPRVLDPGERAPEGWTVTRHGDGTRIATPPGFGRKEEEPEREPSWWEKATDKVTESVRRLGAALESLKEADERSRDTRPSAERLEAVVAEGRDPGEVYRDPLRAVGELTEATGEVVAASAEVALDAAEGTGWAGLAKGLLKRGAKQAAKSKAKKGGKDPGGGAPPARGGGPDNPHLAGHTPQAGSRTTAVRRAAKEEVELVRRTGRGTADWTPDEIAYIQQTGRLPKGTVGHHINSVEAYPEWKGDPRNIRFVRGQSGNLREHGGRFQNPTSGPLNDRQRLMRPESL